MLLHVSGVDSSADPSNSNGSANGDASDINSPDARQRRAALRDTSFDDSPNSQSDYGAIGSSSVHRPTQGEEFLAEGGPVLVNGVASHGPEDYGVPVASSSTQAQLTTTGMAAPSLLPSALPANAPPFVPASQPDLQVQPVFVPSQPVHALLAAGTNHSPRALDMGPVLTSKGLVNVDITVERERQNANPNFPAFLQGTWLWPTTQQEWFNIVLPFVMGFQFTFNSTTDLYYGAQMWASSQLTQLHQVVTRINFPGFYWFSGVAHNRCHNPYFQMMASLPSVRELTFRLHTAALTTSAFGEREMLAIEVHNDIASAGRRPLSLHQVIDYFEMTGIFSNVGLRQVRIQYVDETTIRNNTRGNPVAVIHQLQQWIINGFRDMGLTVYVELVRVD